MYTSVRLASFRSYKELSVELSPSINIIVGPNASGKTNLLEALYVLNRRKSFRADDVALINLENDWARIDGETVDSLRSFRLKKDRHLIKKELHIDGVVRKKILPSHNQPTTLFEPEHLRLLTGSPELRRGYVDDIIAQSEPGYTNHLSQYKRALSQRNRLLKTQPHGWRDQLFVWDLKLSEFGEVISQGRNKTINTLNQKVADIYNKISDKKNNIEIEYRASINPDNYRSNSLKLLSDRIQKDSERGFTGVGPHRDELGVIFNGKDAHLVASRGETRTIVLALKIIELHLLHESTGIAPLLLLDDVFSELDGARRRALTSYLSDYQTIITTTDADSIVKHFLEDDYKVIPTGE